VKEAEKTYPLLQASRDLRTLARDSWTTLKWQYLLPLVSNACGLLAG